MKATSQTIVPQSGPRCPETMFPLVEAKQVGGLSAKQFCAAHGLPEHVFYYWQRRYREAQGGSGFVELELDGVPRSAMRLNLGHGRSLDLDGQVSPRWLGALIRELG